MLCAGGRRPGAAQGAHCTAASAPHVGQWCGHGGRSPCSGTIWCCHKPDSRAHRAVPFTPSQGIKTPSPGVHTAMCYVQHGGLYFANSPVAGMPVNAPVQAWLPAAQQARSLIEVWTITTGRDRSPFVLYTSVCLKRVWCCLVFFGPAQLRAGDRLSAPWPQCMRRGRAATWPAWEGAPATTCTAGRCWAAMRRARSSRAHMRSRLRTRRVAATGRCP